MTLKALLWRLYYLLHVITKVSKCLELKEKKKSHLSSWTLCMCVGTASRPSPAIGSSALACVSCLHGTWRSTRVESLELSCILSHHVPNSAHGLLNPLVYVGIHQSSCSPKHFTPKSFLPGLLVGLLFASTYILCPMWNVFDQCPLYSCFSALRKPKLKEIKASSCLSPSGSPWPGPNRQL